MNHDKLIKIKTYLEKIADINRIVTYDLSEQWKEVYAIVYEELNGIKPAFDITPNPTTGRKSVMSAKDLLNQLIGIDFMLNYGPEEEKEALALIDLYAVLSKSVH